MKVYSLIDKLPEMKGFYAVVHFLTLLYELSLFTDQARTLSSSSFAKIEVHSDSRRVQKVQDYIGKHYQEEIRLGLLADMVGMTEVSFSRFFKLRTGKSLSDYIIDLRLGHATRLLVDSTMAIAEICYECGFNNLSNFNRISRKRRTVLRKSSEIIIERNVLLFDSSSLLYYIELFPFPIFEGDWKREFFCV